MVVILPICAQSVKIELFHCALEGMIMAVRISPLWWPVWAVFSPVLATRMWRHNRVFRENRRRAEELNRHRIDTAQALDLPELDFLELTVLVEERTGVGFRGDPGVSYLLKTDRGVLLFDLGFGPDTPTLTHNAAKLDARWDRVDVVAISHLHPDHMGGTMLTGRDQCESLMSWRR